MSLDIHYILTIIRVQDYSNKEIAILSINKAYCCYFDEGNLQVIYTL